MIYFDHNATTPIDQRVVEAMLPYLTTFYGNPSSLYRMGRAVRSAIDIAREQVAALVDSLPEQIVFTSGGTEANNLALQTLSGNATVAISNIEHPSILEAVNNKKISRLDTLAVNKNGLVLPEAIEVFLQKHDSIDLVSIMLANNENGAIQDITQLTKHQNKNFIVHTDAIQAIGKIPVSFQQLEVDLMSLSSHKIYGPKGCGALVINKNITVSPLLIGGGQENGWRAGTENVAAIVGFGKAAELAQQELEYRSSHCLDLRNGLEKELSSIENLFVFAKDAPRLPNTVQFGIKGIDGEMLLMQLDQKNIAVSSGSACSSGAGKASSVLTAMGVENELAKSAIRISLGQANTKQDVNEFIQTLKLLLDK
ncbi:MAG: cysteine desulfurase [Methylococcales symbiont of Iophon sp. n. MRB-2018]|nr:MAG: cysteine desulfurase [Methylococcales symbiont of Iophon sp. n. MRB-2018]KAF3979567.1 MAG: cysteine desulfurase [Methylococcales symbiont of Iophon sp. n. MRB-2018]